MLSPRSEGRNDAVDFSNHKKLGFKESPKDRKMFHYFKLGIHFFEESPCPQPREFWILIMAIHKWRSQVLSFPTISWDTVDGCEILHQFMVYPIIGLQPSFWWRRISHPSTIGSYFCHWVGQISPGLLVGSKPRTVTEMQRLMKEGGAMAMAMAGKVMELLEDFPDLMPWLKPWNFPGLASKTLICVVDLCGFEARKRCHLSMISITIQHAEMG